jgi:hypothetical protein
MADAVNFITNTVSSRHGAPGSQFQNQGPDITGFCCGNAAGIALESVELFYFDFHHSFRVLDRISEIIIEN